jgi:hypothetical protein
MNGSTEMLGPVAVTALAVGSNGNISMQKGNLKLNRTQTPLPPAPAP